MTVGPAASVPHLDEQTSAARGISPGVVEDGEVILRELFSDHMENGKLTPAALPMDELLRTGASVHRAAHVTTEQVRASVQTRLKARKKKNPGRQHETRISAPITRQIRSQRVKKTSGQIYVVIDTAEVDNPGHASIYYKLQEVKLQKLLPSKMRQLRTELLLPVFQKNLMTVEEALAKIAG